MKFVIERVPLGEVAEAMRFYIEVDMLTLMKLNLDPFDRTLLDDKHETAADYLLVLEMLFRRAAEQGLT